MAGPNKQGFSTTKAILKYLWSGSVNKRPVLKPYKKTSPLKLHLPNQPALARYTKAQYSTVYTFALNGMKSHVASLLLLPTAAPAWPTASSWQRMWVHPGPSFPHRMMIRHPLLSSLHAARLMPCKCTAPSSPIASKMAPTFHPTIFGDFFIEYNQPLKAWTCIHICAHTLFNPC